MPSSRLALLALLPAFAFAALAQQPTPQHSQPPIQPDTRVDIPRTASPEPPPIPPQFNINFTGTWTGNLETLPAPGSAVPANAAQPTPAADTPHTRRPSLLVMRPSPDGRAINFDITTFDPNAPTGVASPDNSVKEREILSFTGPTAILTGTTAAQNQTFQVQGMDAFAKTGYGTLVFTGPGSQDDQPVDLRMTLTLTPNTFTWLRESRPAQSPVPATQSPTPTPANNTPYSFRRQYTFTRSSAPTS